MKITVETIAGKKCTIIRRPFDAEWVREQLDLEQHLLVEIAGEGVTFRRHIFFEDKTVPYLCYIALHSAIKADRITSVLTILPALPRRPKPSDAGLLYRYKSEGITLWAGISGDIHSQDMDFTSDGIIDYLNGTWEITHATYDGRPCQIAIEDNTNE